LPRKLRGATAGGGKEGEKDGGAVDPGSRAKKGKKEAPPGKTLNENVLETWQEGESTSCSLCPVYFQDQGEAERGDFENTPLGGRSYGEERDTTGGTHS